MIEKRLYHGCEKITLVSFLFRYFIKKVLKIIKEFIFQQNSIPGQTQSSNYQENEDKKTFSLQTINYFEKISDLEQKSEHKETQNDEDDSQKSENDESEASFSNNSNGDDDEYLDADGNGQFSDN